MNFYQGVALLAYGILLFLFLYFGSNKFEKGWLTSQRWGNKFNLDFNSFRLIAVVLVVGLVFILAALG